jgi:hypothetical protein
VRAALAVVAGCSGSAGPAPAPLAAPAVIATPRLTADDVEVARVNGHPVWASCVATQAPRIARTAAPGSRGADGLRAEARAEALDQCVAFELMAQAAEARGLAAAPEVAEATRTAAVNRLVETDFEQRYRTPADLPQAIAAVMKRNEWRMHLIQLRGSTFARFLAPTAAPAALDAKAHALADRLAAELAGQTGLYPIHLIEAAARIDAGSDVKLESADVKPTHQDDLVAPYAAALYAIPEVGRTSPAVRTQWGWDVVLWTGGVEPKDTTRDELAAEMFPELRRRQFQLWVTQLGKQLGIHIEIDQANLARLDTEASP